MLRRSAMMFVVLWLALTGAPALAQMPVILPLRERARVMDAWLTLRLDTVVPQLMRREGIDMWILIAREYNEDPVVKTMLPATWLSARRRTILVFHDPGDGQAVERLAVARYDVGELFAKAWDKETQSDQGAALAELVAKRDPQRIAVNVSSTFALADGMAHSQMEGLLDALPESLRGRIVSGERLALGWLETRTPAEIEVYPTICRIAHEIIAEGLSNEVIQPGVTTTDDVCWYYRERIRELKLVAWFHPTVTVQRPSSDDSFLDLFSGQKEVIHRGDLVHIDFGITYLDLNTDTQQMAYVLRNGETQAPEGLLRGYTACNRVQDILSSQFVTGRTGNEMLAAALAQCETEGLEATIYSHPIGYHGHGAGPTIGLWDDQDGIPGRGDYELMPDTAYSIELNCAVTIPEWGDQKVRIMLEEDAFFDGETVRYLDGRQTRPYLIE